jgi:Kef-type K+ transport system membrane component KefB
MKKIYWLYLSVVGILLSGMWLVLRLGDTLEVGKYTGSTIAPLADTGFWSHQAANMQAPLAILLLQISTIILAANLLGRVAVYFKQPTVIGEILAGILLGPSLVGRLFPGFSAFLFPTASLPNLQFLSQIGLILFMFIIGMELDLAFLRKRAQDAFIISSTSIVFPFFLGISISYFLYYQFAPPTVSFVAFALFMGIAMSITAFPVLARIVHERGLTKHPLGTMVIACAASDDVTAWCILAVVITIVKAGTISSALLPVGLSVVYIAAMLLLVKPLMKRVARQNFAVETVNKPIMAGVFLLLLLSAYIAELIGIHALFGAFVAGIVIPDAPEFRRVLANKIEDVSLVLLLPLFFVLTGLRTQIGLLDSWHLWGITAAIIGVAVLGKFAGSAMAARLVGQSWKNSMTIGILMNTRGLMELVVLNIGYDLGILSPTIFAMMVIMALATTFMTGPALDVLAYFSRKQNPTPPLYIANTGFRVLISFGLPKAGSRLLQLLHELQLTQMPNLQLNALHLTPSADISMQESIYFEQEGFAPISETAAALQVPLEKHYKATNNLTQEIVAFANTNDFNLMLMGSSRPLFSDDETGGKVREFWEDVDCKVGVLLDRGFMRIQNVLLVLDSPTDAALLQYLAAFLQKQDTHLTILMPTNFSHQLLDDALTQPSVCAITCLEAEPMTAEHLQQHHLLVVSATFWATIKPNKGVWNENAPSIWVVNV